MVEALQQQMRAAEMEVETLREQLQNCEQAAKSPSTGVPESSFAAAAESDSGHCQAHPAKSQPERKSLPPTWMWSGLPLSEHPPTSSRTSALQCRTSQSPRISITVRPPLQTDEKAPRRDWVGSLSTPRPSMVPCAIGRLDLQTPAICAPFRSVPQEPSSGERSRSLSPTRQPSLYMPIATTPGRAPILFLSSPRTHGDCSSAHRPVALGGVERGMSTPLREVRSVSSPRPSFTSCVTSSPSTLVRIGQPTPLCTRLQSCDQAIPSGTFTRVRQWKLKWVLE